ncbi:MAG: hypothetical protein DKM50_10975 [Candidatus Margulisiibacteriota bacterium]|nr:MAG: hypothetical protein A2X43_07785 [Candidatus Margulisbacteria bacterium GWD2_39_127]OGI03877.1 MAG: hypothetical protein A2X42_09950 [Candidatus Margulisbacteria bacterium GWF2_38_17]OGI08818.1 MAG: hypothetical protein A2X41_05165 [Candidatus Margulisbacteria bacterium GWE2_39_32]PZM78649.1 MAG: hypothetical protein DKM50_10975 [Candidatus Margulisiibacteriota bacterium]HAR61991.1 hypothetical protein [Candidatus Margulisiibacteriota bacterium]
MEIFGLEIAKTVPKDNKIKTTVNAGDKDDFLCEFGKCFRTVNSAEVQKTYMADRSWWKKNQCDVKILNLRDEDDGSLTSLYKEYRKVLLKLYRIKQVLEEG